MDGSNISTAASILSEPPSTSIATVFDIHFLQLRICSHLDSRSIRRCALVSRDFYVAFNPFLWKSIRIRTRAAYKQFIQPEVQAAMACHASIVTEVSSVFPAVWSLFLQQPCLNILVLDSPSLDNHLQRDRNTKYISTVLKLLQKSSRLHTLRLGYFLYESEAVIKFFQAVRQHPSLKYLHIDHRDYVSCTLVRIMLWSTMNLEGFSFSGTVMDYHRRFSTEEERQSLLRLTGQEDPTFGLKELSLPGWFYDHEIDTLFHFLQRCPYLERFKIPGMYWPRQVPALADIVISTMPRLQHLDFSSSPIPGAFVAILVQKCTNLRTFIGHDNHERPLPIVMAVSQHWRTLEVFRMHASSAFRNPAILQLLKTCPELEVLDLMRLESHWISSVAQRRMNEDDRRYRRTGDAFLDVAEMDEHDADNTPWACEKLKVLRINYGIASQDGSKGAVLPRVLYEQLSALPRLEDLRLGWVQSPPALSDDDSDSEDLDATDLARLSEMHISPAQEQELQQSRVQNVGAALQELTKLERLRKLELRGLKSFIDKEKLRQVRAKWEDIEWIQYS